jgi:hypothetical protein
VQRSAEQIDNVSFLDDHTCIHNADPFRHSGDDTQVMSNQEKRSACFCLKPIHEAKDLSLNCNVEGSCWLVGQHQLGSAGKCDRDHHALAHAS